MAGIHHQIGVSVDINNAYDAITTLEGLSSWWTRTTGNTGLGDSLHFHFDELLVDMVIVELSPARKVAWRCTAEEGEWKDTHITFGLVDTGQEVYINFSHTNWTEQTDFCSHCSMKWAVFLLSLKDYLEKGKGHPFPDDIHINHSDY